MTLHLEGVHICHILKQWLRRLYPYSLSAENEMKILVKMVYLEGICMVEADIHVGWTNLKRRAQWDPSFVLVVVPKY